MVKQHVVARGPHRGNWAPCTARLRCRNGGLHVEAAELEGARLLMQALHPDGHITAGDVTPAIFDGLMQDARYPGFVLEAKLAEANQPGQQPQWNISRRTRRHHSQDLRAQVKATGDMRGDREFRREQRTALKELGPRLAEARTTWQLLHPDAPPLDRVIVNTFTAEEPDLAQQVWRINQYVEALGPGDMLDTFSLYSHSRPMRLGEVMEEIVNKVELDVLRERRADS